MSTGNLEDNWLRIGFSEKLTHKKARFGRRKTGEKGVGRISADRLGSYLELKSQAENTTATGLTVDWNKFAEGGRAISAIPIPFLQSPTFNIVRPSLFDKKKKIFRDPLPPTAGSLSWVRICMVQAWRPASRGFEMQGNAGD